MTLSAITARGPPNPGSLPNVSRTHSNIFRGSQALDVPVPFFISTTQRMARRHPSTATILKGQHHEDSRNQQQRRRFR